MIGTVNTSVLADREKVHVMYYIIFLAFTRQQIFSTAVLNIISSTKPSITLKTESPVEHK